MGTRSRKAGLTSRRRPGAGAIWQLATHPRLQNLGLATALIGELEARAAERGITNLRLGVEPENQRARRLYEHLGYRTVGESEASWEAERTDGSRFIYTTRIVEMSKRAWPARGGPLLSGDGRRVNGDRSEHGRVRP